MINAQEIPKILSKEEAVRIELLANLLIEIIDSEANGVEENAESIE
jgi:hypothetical protein